MTGSSIRKPAVAGQFYPASSDELKREISKYVNKSAVKKDALACVMPHAGYMYSGRVAGETISRIRIKDRIILLGPNHTGYGTAFSIMTKGIWQTPLGEVEVDEELAKALVKTVDFLRDDELAHLYEHSIEVEIPFLQYLKDDFRITPIAVASNRLEDLKQVGRGIASCIKAMAVQDEIMLITSSDMTHYETLKRAQEKDALAIKAIEELDEDRLFSVVSDHDISMCGFAPCIVMLACAKLLGAKKGELIKYQTSGDVTGDTSSVVGYAGIIIN